MQFVRPMRLACGLAFIVCGLTPVWAASDPGVVGDIALPIVRLARPLWLLHKEIRGDYDDERATKRLAEERRKMSATGVAVRSLYVGQLPLETALWSLTTGKSMPVVEADSEAAADWLVAHAADPKPLLAASQGHRYVRLTAAMKGAPECTQWADTDWTKQPQAPLEQCLVVTFVDELASDVEMTLDTSRREQHRLEWQFRDRRTNGVLHALPFWASTTDAFAHEVNPEAPKFDTVFEQALRSVRSQAPDVQR